MFDKILIFKTKFYLIFFVIFRSSAIFITETINLFSQMLEATHICFSVVENQISLFHFHLNKLDCKIYCSEIFGLAKK